MIRFLRNALFLLALVTCAQADASPFGLKFLHKGPQTPSTAVLYDTSIGDGTVDTNGFAGLPLRAGDHAYFLNSSTGSDANGCPAAQSSATPKATVSSVMACTTDGHGDHILVAEGTTYTTAPPDFTGLTGGFSYAYPFVVESYDPTDPTNTAKYGHATGSGSHARPVFQHTINWQGGTGQSYIALRGVDINPGNIADQFNQLLDIGSGFLFENDLFRYSGLIIKINHRTSVGQHWIVRNTSVFSEWGTGQINGLYISGGWPITVEDSVLYHNGWKEGGLGRGDATEGANVFTHPFYIQHTTKIISRRNLIADGSADCGSHRDDAIIQNNVYLYCPITIAAGGGNNPPEASPWGDALDVTANVILNGNDLNSLNTRGWGIDTLNGNAISITHYNLLAHNTGTGQNSTFSVDSIDGANSRMIFDHNISSQWSSSGGTYVARDTSANDHPTFTNNIWDDPASGSNINRSSATFPNGALDAPALATGAGYASYTAMMQYAVLNPEAHIQRTLRATAMAAYGQTGPPLTDLGVDFTDWRTGNLELVAIVGTQPESTLALGGTWPTGFSIDSNTRFYKLDGTQAAGSGTGTIIETPNGGGATHTTTVNWTVGAAPQLSSLSVSGVTSTTATINVTTDTGNGTLYYVLDDLGDGDCDGVSYCTPLLPGVVKGGVSYNYYTYVKSGSAAVAASGVRSISVIGLTSGKFYCASEMQVSGGGVWSPTTNGMHAIGPVCFTTP